MEGRKYSNVFNYSLFPPPRLFNILFKIISLFFNLVQYKRINIQERPYE